MKESIINRIRRQPIVAFYILAFIITWLGWVPQAAYSHGLFPFNSPVFYVLGGFGPLVAALIVAHALYGKKDGEILLKPLLQWRVRVIWYVAALGGGVFIMLAAAVLSGSLGMGLDRLTPSLAMLQVFLTYLVAAIPEEVAWRGFVLPRLQSRYSALVSTLIVGTLWALWHIPLLLIKGSTMSTYPLLPYFIGIIADSVIYTWLYNSSRGSVLIVTLFHAVYNTVGPNMGVPETAVVLVLAATIVAVSGPAQLSYGGGRIVRNDGIDIT